jgi:hypothetical protein
MCVGISMDFAYRPQFTLMDDNYAIENIKYEDIYFEECDYQLFIVFICYENDYRVVRYLLHLPFT